MNGMIHLKRMLMEMEDLIFKNIRRDQVHLCMIRNGMSILGILFVDLLQVILYPIQIVYL